MLSVASCCCPSMIAHPRSRVACTTSERMVCRASIGTSHGLCHHLLRPPCRPLPARVGVEEHHTAFAPMEFQSLTSPVTQCVQEATLCFACGGCAQTRRIPCMPAHMRDDRHHAMPVSLALLLGGGIMGLLTTLGA